MKNHLACIRSLYQADKLSEMECYINELVETSNIQIDLFDTGNDIVNAILNDAQSRFRKDNIKIRLEGGFPQELYVTPMDLCVIFANLISNAVEAVQGMENVQNSIRYIDVKISSYKNDLYIDVKNPTDKNIRLSGGSLITTKKDKTLHGFGIKNVIQRVEKYRGTYHFKLENNQFYVEIIMKNER
jgi:sensor histidine kinase regulating citrate/malate metabolism